MTQGELIKDLCIRNGISVSRLEKELRFGNGSIGKHAYVRSDRLYMIAKYFGVSMESLMDEEVEVPKKKSALDLFAGPGALPYSDALEKCMKNKKLYQYLINYAQFLVENEGTIK